MRAFIAIKLPAGIRRQLVSFQDRLKPVLVKVKWVEPQNLHLSLKFLGEISQEQLGQIKQIISQACLETPIFRLSLDNLGCFPNPELARIIWAGTKNLPPELNSLSFKLEERISAAGIPKEERQYQAHITLGRIKDSFNCRNLENKLVELNREILGMDLKLDVSRLTLFESLLGKNGPVYTEVWEENLKF